MSQPSQDRLDVSGAVWVSQDRLGVSATASGAVWVSQGLSWFLRGYLGFSGAILVSQGATSAEVIYGSAVHSGYRWQAAVPV